MNRLRPRWFYKGVIAYEVTCPSSKQHAYLNSSCGILWVNTLRPRQIADISQMIFSNAFSWMNMDEFRIIFHWSLSLRSELTTFQHWVRWWRGVDQATSLYLNQWWLFYRHMYGSLRHSGLTMSPSLWCHKQNHVIFDCVIEALDCSIQQRHSSVV